MKIKRFALVFVVAIAFGFCLAPVTSHATMTSFDRPAAESSCSPDTDLSVDRPVTGPKCIPCSPNHPCVNPLTICTYSGNSTHGCCLGYAGGK